MPSRLPPARLRRWAGRAPRGTSPPQADRGTPGSPRLLLPRSCRGHLPSGRPLRPEEGEFSGKLAVRGPLLMRKWPDLWAICIAPRRGSVYPQNPGSQRGRPGISTLGYFQPPEPSPICGARPPTQNAKPWEPVRTRSTRKSPMSAREDRGERVGRADEGQGGAKRNEEAFRASGEQESVAASPDERGPSLEIQTHSPSKRSRDHRKMIATTAGRGREPCKADPERGENKRWT